MMSKRALLIAAAILIVVGAIAATKSLTTVTSPTATQHSAVATVRPASPVPQSEMMAIVPAPVHSNSAVFVGTGDGSNGNWYKPTRSAR
jgi:hypothetical protein